MQFVYAGNTKNTTALIFLVSCLLLSPSASFSSQHISLTSSTTMVIRHLAAHSSSSSPAAAAAAAASKHRPDLKVAVIGAGAAGLAAARVLSRNGVDAKVLEKDDFVGGIWHYDAQFSDSRPMYRGLRTNLPKEVMQYREYPWIRRSSNTSHGPTDQHATSALTQRLEDVSFLSHYNVAEYLRQYEKDFDLRKFISFGSTVQQLTVLTIGDDSGGDVSQASPPHEKWPKIRLDWRDGNSSRDTSEVFDAVYICNGHYAQPSFPSIPGLEEYFRGRKVMHSIAYDDPSEFQGQVVLCIGGRASGADLAREISFHARHVYLSDTTCTEAVDVGQEGHDETTLRSSTANVTWVPKTVSIRPDGSVQFDKNCTICPTNVDTIIFCSGYDYSFPFINERSNINVQAVPGERRVSPLYLQLVSFTFCVAMQHGIVICQCSSLGSIVGVSSILCATVWIFYIFISHFNPFSGMLSTPTWHLLVFLIPSFPSLSWNCKQKLRVPNGCIKKTRTRRLHRYLCYPMKKSVWRGLSRMQLREVPMLMGEFKIRTSSAISSGTIAGAWRS